MRQGRKAKRLEDFSRRAGCRRRSKNSISTDTFLFLVSQAGLEAFGSVIDDPGFRSSFFLPNQIISAVRFLAEVRMRPVAWVGIPPQTPRKLEVSFVPFEFLDVSRQINQIVIRHSPITAPPQRCGSAKPGVSAQRSSGYRSGVIKCCLVSGRPRALAKLSYR